MAGAIGRVFLDANVLYSRTVRDWLGLLYIDEVFEPPFHAFWSEDVLAEAMYHLRQNNPTWDGAKVAVVRDRIAGTFEDGRVTDFVVDGSYGGPDHKECSCARRLCGVPGGLPSNGEPPGLSSGLSGRGAVRGAYPGRVSATG